MRKTLSILLALSVTLSGCASGPKSDVFYSSEEQAVGDKIHAEIISSFHVYTEPKLKAYISGVGDNLSQYAERKLPYRFTVLYNDKIYATSAPGGYVYITTGFINFLQNESELAAVLAHEIGELQFKEEKLDGTRRFMDSMMHGAAMVGPMFGQIGALAVLGVVLTSALVDSTKTTPEKRMIESDGKALAYMMSAGYDPQSYLDMLQKFLFAEDKYLPYFYDYYQSRPITEARMESVFTHFAKLDLADKAFDTHYKLYQESTKGVREIYRIS